MSTRKFKEIDSRRKVRNELLERDATCTYCSVRLDKKTATIDHIIPKSRGGGEDSVNLTLACFDCNQKKGDEVWFLF